MLTVLPFSPAFLGHSSLHLLRNPYSSPVRFGTKNTLPNKKNNSSFIKELLLLINAEYRLCSPPSLLPSPSLSDASPHVPSSFNAIVIRCHHRLRKSPYAAAVIVTNPLSPRSLVAVSRCRSLSLAAALLPIYRPPPPPPFLVSGRHHHHLLSAVAAPLVAGAIAHSSPPPSPASTLTSSEIGQQRMGGGVR